MQVTPELAATAKLTQGCHRSAQPTLSEGPGSLVAVDNAQALEVCPLGRFFRTCLIYDRAGPGLISSSLRVDVQLLVDEGFNTIGQGAADHRN